MALDESLRLALFWALASILAAVQLALVARSARAVLRPRCALAARRTGGGVPRAVELAMTLAPAAFLALVLALARRAVVFGP